MKRKLLLAGVIASFLIFVSSLNGPANAQIGIGRTSTNLTLSGVLSLADGTIALPSLTNTGDTDTGIFFPSANTIAFTVGGKDLGEWHVATGTLTATQVRKLNATPVEVVVAPGSGFALVPESFQVMLDFGGTAYDSVAAGEDLRLRSAAEAKLLCDEASCINANAGGDDWGIVRMNPDNLGEQLDDNSPLQIDILNAEWASADNDANGNSPIHYLIRYRIVTLDLS